jgi:hypothetical protein
MATDLSQFTVPNNRFDVAQDNAAKLDSVLNGPNAVVTTRTGKGIQSIDKVIESIAAVVDRGTWTTATSYQVKDLVLDTGIYYIAVTAHTSGATFAGDIANWRVYQGVTTNQLGFQALRSFNSLALAIASTDIAIGDTIYIRGRTALNDGGDDFYLVESLGVPDGFGDHATTGIASAQLTLRLDDRIDARKYGVSTAAADNKPSLQAAIDRSTALGFKAIDLPGGTLKFLSDINLSGTNPTVNPDPFPLVPIWGKGVLNTTLDFSGSTDGRCILVERGSGGLAMQWFGDFKLISRTTTTTFDATDIGIEIAGKGGVIPTRITFDDLSIGIEFHNKDAGSFTEYCFAYDCVVARGCLQFIKYKITSGNESFHGSGFKNALINTDANEVIVQVDNGALVYNAPISGQVWTFANATLISNDNTDPRRTVTSMGDITHESFSSSVLTMCVKTAGADHFMIGGYHAFGGKVKLGDSYMVEQTRTNPDGSINVIFKPRSITVDITTGANTVFSKLSQVTGSGAVEWSVLLIDTNYRFQDIVHTTRDAGTGSGPTNVVSSLSSNNTAGYGAPAYTVDASGSLVITQAGFPASGVTAFITMTPLGQRSQDHEDADG